jgi:hypothetical protein
MVRTTRAEFGQARGVATIHEAEDFLVVLHGTDEPLACRDLAAQPRQDRGKYFAPLRRRQGVIFRAAEGRSVSAFGGIFLLQVRGGALDKIEGANITRVVVIRPGNEPVLAHHNGLRLRLPAVNLLHGQAQLEARPHPRHVGHFVTKNFARQLLAVGGSGHGDDGVRVHVVHLPAGQEGVQRRVNRGGARVEIERAMRVERHHVVLRGGFDPLVRARGVNFLQGVELIQVERGEKRPRARAQIAARALDPQDLLRLGRQRVFLGDFSGGVAAAGIGDALVTPEQIRAVDQPGDGVERRSLGLVPQVIDVLVTLHIAPAFCEPPLREARHRLPEVCGKKRREFIKVFLPGYAG